MIQQISLSVFLITLLTTLYFLYKRLPLVESLPEKERESIKIKIKKKLKKFSFKKRFSWNSFMQKILSRIRVIIIKVESKIGNQLQSLRKNSNRPG